MSAEQRTALRPLREHWADIDALRKQKWLEIAQRFHKMAPAERARLHGRMALWASLSPEQRNNARLTFQEAQQLPPEVLHDRWASYLSLSEEERQELARQGTAVPPAPPRAALRHATPGASRTKSNVVPNPLHAAPAQPVAATLLRAWPGATTTALRHPAPPAWHLQPGLPKIAVAPRFIDPKTLAPRVGPQALGVLRSEGSAPP